MQEKMIKNFAKLFTDWNHKQDFFLKILQESLHKFMQKAIILKFAKLFIDWYKKQLSRILQNST